MKTLLLALALLIPAVSRAIIVTLFEDMDTFTRRGAQILIVNCISTNGDKAATIRMDGIYEAEVLVLRSLKGDYDTGRLRVKTLYPMTVGRTYMFYTLGGPTATAELSVVEVPPTFDWEREMLVEKPLRDLLLVLFRERLIQVNQELAMKTSLLASPRDADRKAFWIRLKNPPRDDHLSQYLQTHFSPQTRDLLAHYDERSGADNAEARLSAAVLHDLRLIIWRGSIYEKKRFDGVKVSPETAKILIQNPSDAGDLVRLNIALLLDAYPVGLWRDPYLEAEKAILEKAIAAESSGKQRNKIMRNSD